MKIEISKYLRVAVGFILLFIIVFYFGAEDIVNNIVGLNPQWILLAVILICLSTFLGSINIYILLRTNEREKQRYSSILQVYWLSWAIGLVVPGQVGDVASLTLLLKKKKLVWTDVLGYALLDKVISFIVISSFASIGLISLIMPIGLSVSAVIVLAVFSLVLYVSFKFGKIFLRKKKNSYDSGDSKGKIISILIRITSNISELYSDKPGIILVNAFISINKVILIGLSYWAVFASLGYQDISALMTVLLSCASSIVAYIPVSFNGLGTVEITGITLFYQLGMGAAAVTTVYIVLRILVLIIAWVPSLGIMLLRKQEESHFLN